jgi:hypothetical protein
VVGGRWGRGADSRQQAVVGNITLRMNPFATRYVRPGAIAFRFAAGEGAEQLVERLRANDWQGQIVGGHGTGKSTLLAALLPALERAGRRVVRFALHDGERRLPAEPGQLRSLRTPDVLLIDGFEQLSAFARFSIKRRCRKQGCGLLVTAHADVGLPWLYSTEVSPELAQQLVSQLVPAADQTIAGSDIIQALADNRGNFREALFRLYDLYEQRR